jgi:hypothetical protein
MAKGLNRFLIPDLGIDLDVDGLVGVRVATENRAVRILQLWTSAFLSKRQPQPAGGTAGADRPGRQEAQQIVAQLGG